MRLFIAILLNNDAKTYLSSVQTIVKSHYSGGNDTDFNNFHMTLNFIGEKTQKEADELKMILNKLKERLEAFPVKIGGVSSFRRGNKEIVYASVIENMEALYALVKTLDALLAPGFPPNPNFKPHVTLVREAVPISKIRMVMPDPKCILVDSIALMLSSRDASGKLVYTPLYTVNLNTK